MLRLVHMQVPGEYESRDSEVAQHHQWTLTTNGVGQLIDIQANVKNGLERQYGITCSNKWWINS